MNNKPRSRTDEIHCVPQLRFVQVPIRSLTSRRRMWIIHRQLQRARHRPLLPWGFGGWGPRDGATGRKVSQKLYRSIVQYRNWYHAYFVKACPNIHQNTAGNKADDRKKQFTEFHRKIHVYMCMLNRCLEWYKWLNSGLTHLFHRRTSHQWCMLFVAASANWGGTECGKNLYSLTVNKVMCACVDIACIIGYLWWWMYCFCGSTWYSPGISVVSASSQRTGVMQTRRWTFSSACLQRMSGVVIPRIAQASNTVSWVICYNPIIFLVCCHCDFSARIMSVLVACWR